MVCFPLPRIFHPLLFFSDMIHGRPRARVITLDVCAHMLVFPRFEGLHEILDLGDVCGLSGSHRSTHIASDFASQALASQAKPQQESESQAFRIDRSWKNLPIFRIAGQHRRIFAEGFSGIFLWFQIKRKKNFRIASDLGVCDSNRIAHRGRIARFGLLSLRDIWPENFLWDFQGNAAWVAPACADCPVFLVLGSAPAPASTLVLEPQIDPVGPGLAFCSTGRGSLDIAWICCPQLPHHPCKNRKHSTCFYSTGGARAENLGKHGQKEDDCSINSENILWCPLVYPYPKNARNSDHGLSFRSPKTQTMVWVSPFPNKYRVWGGLSFGPKTRTMVWVSSGEGRNTGVGVDEWALNSFMQLQWKFPTNYFQNDVFFFHIILNRNSKITATPKALVKLRFHCDFCGKSLRLQNCDWQSLAICHCNCVGH